MYLFGASGHAKVIIDILKSMNKSVIALIDDNKDVNSLLEYEVLHEYDDLSPIIISIGDNRIRKLISQKLSCDFGVGIHKSAIVSELAKISEGTVVMQGAIIQADAKVGKHSIINTGASVDHDCEISDYVHISPHATLCGNVTVGEGSWVGAGSTVIQGTSIGKWVVIGAGAVVTKDVPDYAVVAGVPAKILKYKEQK